MRTIFAEYNPQRNSIDIYTNVGYMLRIDCWEAEKDLKTTPGSDCALTSSAFNSCYDTEDIPAILAIPDTLFFLPAFPFSDYCLKRRKAQSAKG